MRGSLKISEDLSLPLSAATQTFAFLARKGAGKTYAAGKLVELLLEKRVQVVTIDTVGNWYGLRINKDGKSNGFDIPIFGGLRGDLPIEANAGELIADVVVDSGRSVIIDISQFNLADRKRFATSFGERLWKRKKAQRIPSPMTLVIEESQLIVPQFAKGSEHMLGIYEEIIRLGRNYGIGVVMISQRPQSVNKEVLNQTECLFVLQTNGKQERKAIKDWVVYQGVDVNLVDELPSLPIGTAWVWSPQWLGILKKVKIAPKQTFDSSATPKVGSKIARRNPSPLDMAEIESKMKDLVERAKQDDPRELKKQISALQVQLKNRPTEVKQDPVIQRVEVPVLNGEVKEMRDLFSQFGKQVGVLREISDTLSSLDTLLERTNVKIDRVVSTKREPIENTKIKMPWEGIHLESKLHPDAFKPFASKEQTIKPVDATGIKLRSGERQILITLKQFDPKGLNDSTLRLLAGSGFNAKTYETYKSVLRNLNFIIQNGSVWFITQAGSDYIGDVESVPHSTEELYSFWAKKVRDGERSILRTGIDVYPEYAKLEDKRAELPKLSDKTFDTYISVLKNMGLIEVDGGYYRASQSFFVN